MKKVRKLDEVSIGILNYFRDTTDDSVLFIAAEIMRLEVEKYMKGKCYSY